MVSYMFKYEISVLKGIEWFWDTVRHFISWSLMVTYLTMGKSYPAVVKDGKI